jgi:hypothetical protein
LQETRRLRDLEKLKSRSRTRTGRINPLAVSKQSLRISKQKQEGNSSRLEGIKEEELHRQKDSDECFHCAWPFDRKGSPRAKDFIRPIKLDKGTAKFPGKKHQQATDEEVSSEVTSSEESSDDSL